MHSAAVSLLRNLVRFLWIDNRALSTLRLRNHNLIWILQNASLVVNCQIESLTINMVNVLILDDHWSLVVDHGLVGS